MDPDILDGEGDGDSGDGGEDGLGENIGADALAAPGASAVCLSCGHQTNGPFCAWCGQKNDDLRRSSLMLARDFVEDTFSFDSRMWRTLGLLAVSPGIVPKEYAHGRRSRFTPPVRLYLVVSFLFFLTIGLTNTLFVGFEVTFTEAADEGDSEAEAHIFRMTDKDDASDQGCNFSGNLQFLVKEKDLYTDKERLDRCVKEIRDRAEGELANAGDPAVDRRESNEDERRRAWSIVDRVFAGVNWAVANPREFNDAFNDWLPRVLFFMTPVLALILALFLRRGALIFDHLVMSFYLHAAGFSVTALSLIAAQLGAPSFVALGAFILLAGYYVITLKRTYRRGWVKTVWTAAMSSAIYLFILIVVILAIVSNIIWSAAA